MPIKPPPNATHYQRQTHARAVKRSQALTALIYNMQSSVHLVKLALQKRDRLRREIGWVVK